MSYTPFYKKGDWKAVCDRCGFDYKALELKETWDHLMVCRKCWEPRQPQDFIRGKRDNQAIDWSRTEGTDVESDVTFTTGTELLWTERAAFTASDLYGIHYVSGLWVIVGAAGLIRTSTDDGATWTARTSGVSVILWSVNYWGGNWYVVGSGAVGNPATILKSADGITWTPIVVGVAQNVLVDIAFNDTTMVFIGWDTSFDDYLLKTTDGTIFTEVSNLGTVEAPTNIVWNSVDSLWGAVGETGANQEWFGTSSDLITWTKKSTGASGVLAGLEYDGVNWITAASTIEILTSPDSTSWTQREEADVINTGSQTITNNNGVILLCGGGTSDHGVMLISRDNGVTWRLNYEADSSVVYMQKANYGNGIWIAVGRSGRVVIGVETALVEDQIPDGTFDNSL